MPSIFETSGRLPEAWAAALLAAPDNFVALEQAGGRITVAGLVWSAPLEADRTLITLPERLPDEALQLTQCKLTPIYTGAINVGWLVRLPAQQVLLGRNYLHISRATVPAARTVTPKELLNLKTIVILEIPDTVALLLSPRVHDVRT